ncbi:hypothetical protein Barb6XT_01727 [Bacteroidales bacterium Barb6XT]|nr:hypothetical protein Barb6XT_01727 [Bacteroidales bacterium Barb6XT]
MTPVIFYYNPNIYPQAEYERRKAECTRYAHLLGLTIVDGDYNHPAWADEMKGLEREPERGRRCLRCFTLRLAETARFTHENGYKVFATTLASSRWKSLSQINEAGQAAALQYPETSFRAQNWRKGGLSERRRELVALHNFYNQTYCGCEYSQTTQNRLEQGCYRIKNT